MFIGEPVKIKEYNNETEEMVIRKGTISAVHNHKGLPTGYAVQWDNPNPKKDAHCYSEGILSR